MTLLRRSLIVGATAWAATVSASAQEIETSLLTKVTPMQHGGIFHVATGTWTRNVPQAVNLGPDIIYNNTANTGGVTSGGIQNQTASFDFADAGIIPSTSNPVAGNRDNYNVNCIEIAYCLADDSGATGPLNVEVQLYNQYTTCQDPASAVNVGGFLGTSLPNFDPVTTPAGFLDCWLVEFDLSGGGEICIKGDGDGVFSGTIDFDQFGIGVRFDPDASGGYVGGIPVGPILAGDRDWTAAAVGGPYGFGGGGDTYYGPAETCVPMGGGENSSGFENEDIWWTGERLATAQPAGCFFFGGYANPNGCAADGTMAGHVPNTGLYALIQADTTTDCVELDPDASVGVPFCNPANANSTGLPAVLSGTTLASGVGSGLHLEVNQGPADEFGYMLIGTEPETAMPITISNGLLCLSVMNGNVFGRYNFGSDTNSIGQFDAAGIFQNLVGTATSTGGSGFDVPTTNPIPGQPAIMAGATWHFQLWYRDTPAGAGESNLTNGLSVTF